MNKITSILFLYITFLPAFSYAAIPNRIMTDMAGALYTNQSAHATNTDEYVANFAPTPSMLSTDTNTQQQYKEQIEEPTNQAIDLCKKSGGDWEQNTCNCEKYGMEYDKQKLRCTHTEIPSEKRSYQQQSNDFTPKQRTINEITTNDATTLITVSVVDHYDSNKKIKDIEICYENIDSCKTTNKNGIATFKHNHIATEEISPIISVKPSSDYHCDEPIDTSASMNLDVDDLIIMGSGNYKLRQKNTIPADNTSFDFVVKCKQLCTDKDLKKVPNATACYVRGKKDYEILRCAADYTNIDNKCEPNPKLPVKEKRIDTIGNVNQTKTSEQKKLEEEIELASEEQIFEKRHTCSISKSSPKPTWDGTECICPNTAHVFNYNNGLCEELKTNDELCTDSGGKWKKNKATCDCPKNKNYNPNTRKCEDTNAEEICKTSGGDWNGKKCKCDENKGLTRNKNTGICECTNTTYKYNTESKKCTKTAQDIAIDNEFDRQNRINNRLRDACENSGGSYDQISKDIADSYVCNCQTDQTLNTQSGLCECTESGYRYSATKKKCIKPEITMDEYKQIESEINDAVADTASKIKTQCPDDKTDAPCDKKDDLIKKIEELAKDTLDKLKDLGKEQYN